MLRQTAIGAHGSAPSQTVSVARLILIGVMAFLTVVDLFAAQALLPSLTHHYGVMPATMGLAVNACTLGMAIGGLGVAWLGDRLPRRRGLLLSLSFLAIPTLLLSVAPDVATFSALRVVQGLAMSIAFGLTLAYLGERYMAANAASAFAAYITGNVASNLIGRLIATAAADHAGLAAPFIVFALLNLSGAVLVYFANEGIPQSSRAPSSEQVMQSAIEHVSNPALRAGFAIGFCILFAFIGTFTYINFELVKPPLALGMMQLGVIYFVFLPSIITTPLAGRAVAMFGVRNALWASLSVAGLGLPLLLVPRLTPVITGMVLVAAGTFFAQAVATGFVSRTATHHRSAATGIYLASYFIGGLVGAALLGALYQMLGWVACVAGIGASLAAAAILTLKLRPSANPE